MPLCAQRGEPTDILAMFGQGKKGSILVLARLVLSHTSMWLYGGFIRDLVLRGDVHDGMDLDVGLPKTGMDASTGMTSIAQLASAVNMHFMTTNPRDPRVVRGFFKAVDSSVEIEVQVWVFSVNSHNKRSSTSICSSQVHAGQAANVVHVPAIGMVSQYLDSRIKCQTGLMAN